MKSMSVKDIRKRLGEVIRDAEAGDATVITRYGKPVATIAPVEQVRPTLPDMSEFRASIEYNGRSLTQTLKQMRQEERA